MAVFTTRRDALLGLSSLALAPACTFVSSGGGDADQAFPQGVASGDPDASSVVIWTRVNPQLNVPSLRWVVSEDPGFGRVVASGDVVVVPERDFTAKVLVRSLQPARSYYYRFATPAGDSPVGCTRTLSVGPAESLKLAVASCSNYPFGYFNAYDAIAQDDDIDFVLHLGDYIYEYGADGWGGDVGEALGRQHAPTHEIVSLADYRTRHAQYKSDPGSRRMHAAHPLIPVWDDHESANNPWMGGAENHTPATEGEWAVRRAASIRAYYEWMPIREPSAGADPAAYWRHYEFGDLASLVTLETRHTGRSRQIDYAEYLDEIRSDRAAQRFVDEILGDPSRTMISPEMLAFCSASLGDAARAKCPWKLIGNQIPIGKVNVPSGATAVIEGGGNPDHLLAAELAQLKKLAEYNLPIYLDTWDGYPTARENLYQRAVASGVEDVLVLTGDSHAFWLNALSMREGRKVGYEIGTAGITSPGDFERFGGAAAAALDAQVIAHNPEVIWTDNRNRGFVTVTLDRESAQVRYMGVSNVASPTYELREIKRVEISHVGSRLEAWMA